MLPQGGAGLPKARQPPSLVLQFQSQLLARLLEALYLPPEASGLLKLKRPGEVSGEQSLVVRELSLTRYGTADVDTTDGPWATAGRPRPLGRRLCGFF